MHSRDLIEQYKGYVQDWRRYFHKHPELSNEEFETTKILAKELESMGSCRYRAWHWLSWYHPR